MRIAYCLSCAAALGFLSVPAISAQKTFELTEVSGKVLVTTKNGIVPAVLGQQVSEGTRIFVGEDASARITAADGNCDVPLPSKKVTVLNYQKLCEITITPTATDGPSGGVPPPVVGLAFFTAVAIVGGIAIADDDDDNSVSAP
jgi:hypothetical protein